MHFSAYPKFFLLLLVITAKCHALGSSCSVTTPTHENKLSSKLSSEHMIIGEGRAFFYDAPNEQCLKSDLFLVPGDLLNVISTQVEFSRISYTHPISHKKSVGWIKNDRLRPTGVIDGAAVHFELPLKDSNGKIHIVHIDSNNAQINNEDEFPCTIPDNKVRSYSGIFTITMSNQAPDLPKIILGQFENQTDESSLLYEPISINFERLSGNKDSGELLLFSQLAACSVGNDYQIFGLDQTRNAIVRYQFQTKFGTKNMFEGFYRGPKNPRSETYKFSRYFHAGKIQADEFDFKIEAQNHVFKQIRYSASKMVE